MWAWSTPGHWSITHRARLTMALSVLRRKLPAVWQRPKRQTPSNMRVIDRCNSTVVLVLPGSVIRHCLFDARHGANSNSVTQCIIASAWHRYCSTPELLSFGRLAILATVLITFARVSLWWLLPVLFGDCHVIARRCRGANRWLANRWLANQWLANQWLEGVRGNTGWYCHP